MNLVKKLARAFIIGMLSVSVAFAGLETGTYISDLVATNPTAGDNVSQGDDHLRLVKSTIKNTFPNLTGAVNSTQDEINAATDGSVAATSFTPAIEGESTAGSGTYTVAQGNYFKIGRLVFVQIRLTWSAHTGTGEMRITGLPVAALTGNLPRQPLGVAATNFTYPGELKVTTESGATYLKLYSQSAGGSLSGVTMDTVGTLYISGAYLADS